MWMRSGGEVWGGLVVLAHSLAKGGLSPWFSKGDLSHGLKVV